MGRFYPAALELVPLFILGCAIYLVVTGYAGLPGTIPTHFDFRGVADGWGDRSSLWSLAGLSAFLYLLFTGITWFLGNSPDPKRWINLPATVKENITGAQAQQLMAFLGRCLLALKTLILGLFLCNIYLTIAIARGETVTASYYHLLLAAAIGAVVIALLVRVFILVYRAPAQNAPPRY